MQRRFTRTSNADIHPGLSSCPTPRRSSAQVQADKAAQAAAKEEAAQQKNDNMTKVAHLEQAVRKKMKQTDAEANQPRDKLTIPRTTRAKKNEIQGIGLLFTISTHYGVI